MAMKTAKQIRCTELVDSILLAEQRKKDGSLNHSLAETWIKKDKYSLYLLMPDLFPEYKKYKSIHPDDFPINGCGVD